MHRPKEIDKNLFSNQQAMERTYCNLTFGIGAAYFYINGSEAFLIAVDFLSLSWDELCCTFVSIFDWMSEFPLELWRMWTVCFWFCQSFSCKHRNDRAHWTERCFPFGYVCIYSIYDVQCTEHGTWYNGTWYMCVKHWNRVFINKVSVVVVMR